MRDFIQQAWKQIKIIDNDKYHENNIKQLASSTLKSSLSHNNSTILAKTLMNSKDFKQIKTIKSIEEKPQIDPLDEQVMIRRKAASKIPEVLENIKRKKIKELESYNNESRKIEMDLEKIKNKINKANTKLETNTVDRKSVV